MFCCRFGWFLRLSPTFSADEAPADINVLMVLHTPARDKVVGADDAVVGEDDAARRHAQVRGVVGYRTANASYQTTYGARGALSVRKAGVWSTGERVLHLWRWWSCWGWR